MTQTLILLALIYSLADRYAGGGWPWLDDHLPFRAAVNGGLIATVLALFAVQAPIQSVTGQMTIYMGLAWTVQRTLAWGIIPGGSTTPTTIGGYIGTFIRHGLLIPAAAGIAYALHVSPIWPAECMAAYALAATILAALYGRNQTVAWFNTFVELARGACFGVALGFMVLV